MEIDPCPVEGEVVRREDGFACGSLPVEIVGTPEDRDVIVGGTKPVSRTINRSPNLPR